jgi:hypothetical protein
MAVSGLSVFANAGASRAIDQQTAFLEQRYAEIPLAFEPNEGQTAPDVQYISRTRGLTVLLRADGVTVVAHTMGVGGNNSAAVAAMDFVGAVSSRSKPLAFDKQQGVSNYLIGDDPDKWHAGIANYGRVRYSGLYPGIDLVFYGDRQKLEHDFVVGPWADYKQIRMRFSSVSRVLVNQSGDLEVSTAGGLLIFRAPEIYQWHAGKRVAVEGGYRVLAENEFGFTVGSYDRGQPLVIDPILGYSTYLAGSNADNGASIAVDRNGSAYVTGYTFSTDFPLKNPEQSTSTGTPDVFVTKFNASGSALVYSTFVGGSGYDQGARIAVDGNGNALVAGTTTSPDFPLKNGITVVLSTYSTHGFAFSLAPAGNKLNFSTYLGGTGQDATTGITTDSTGAVYASGYTTSSNFPLSPGHLIGVPPGNGSDLFLVKFTHTGKLTFSTMIGGSGTGYNGTFGNTPWQPISVVVDSLGEAILSGAAFDGFPTTSGSFQPSYLGGAYGTANSFIGKLNSSGTGFVYATYLGGTGAQGGDGATSLALDPAENVFITGTTGSMDFPTTPGAFQENRLNTGNTAFITKMDPALSNLLFSTYLQGTQNASGSGVSTASIAVDGQGSSYVVGTTNQSDLPLINPLISILPQNYFTGNFSAFLSVLNASGSALTFSTFYSGSTGTNGLGVAVDSSNNPYMTGVTSDQDFPTTPGAFQSTIPPQQGQYHAFVTKFLPGVPNAGACLSASTLYFPALEPGQKSYPVPLTIQNCGTLELTISQIVVTNPVFKSTGVCKKLLPGTSCTIKVRYAPVVADGQDLGTLQITDNAPIATQNVQLTGYSALPNIQIFNAIAAPDEVVGLTGAPVLGYVQTYGALPLHITSLSATGDFTPVNLCPKALDPGQTCFLGVRFTPTAAGPRTGTLYVYDDAYGSPQSISLSGNGLATYPTPNITFLSPGSAAAGSGATKVYVYGDEIFPTTTVLVNGKIVPSKQPTAGQLVFTLPKSVLKKIGNVTIQVVNPPPGGVSAPVGFAVYGQVTLGAADVIYEPVTKKFYASIPANSSNSPNSLVTVDPVTGVTGPPIPIGNDPGPLALSSDGKTLYVGLSGDYAIVPFDITTQTAGSEIFLGADPQKGPLRASNIQVQPGNPNNLVVTVTAGYGGPDGIELIENGQIISQFLNEPPNNTAVGGSHFVGSSDVFAWQSIYGSIGLDHFVIIQDNLYEAPGISGLYGIGPFDSDGTNLFDVNGQIFNAASGALVGSFPQINNYNPELAVLMDSGSGRVFFLNPGGGIMVFDATTFALLGTIGTPNANSPSYRLQHWGNSGLSFTTYSYSSQGYDLLLLSTGLFNAAGVDQVPAK